MLAFLFFNLFLKHVGKRVLPSFVFELLNWGIGIPILLFALAGKAVIVNFYNDNTFKEISQSIQKLIHSPKEWFADKHHALRTLTWKDIALAIPNAAMTLNMSLIFGIGITHLSFTNMSTLLLDNYSNSAIRVIAHYCSKLYVMAFFMACSVLCNLMGFPYIHKSSISKIFQPLNRMLENSDIQLWKAELTRAIQTVSRRWEYIILNQNNQRMMTNFLNKLFNIESESLLSLDTLDTEQVEEILKLPIDPKHLLSLRQLNNPYVEPVFWDEYLVTRGMGLAITALTIAGLYNFRQMGIDTIKLLHISSPVIQNASGIAAFTSMCLMAIDAVMQPAIELIANALFARDYVYHPFSCRMRFILGMLLFCSMLLGGFPNGYQEYTAGGSYASVAIALFSSAMVEVFAIYLLAYSLLERKMMNNNPTLYLANGISKKIQTEIVKLKNAPPEQIKELQAIIQPDYAEHIQNTSLESSSWKWVKKSTNNIGSCLINWYSTRQCFPSQVLSERSPLLSSTHRPHC